MTTTRAGTSPDQVFGKGRLENLTLDQVVEEAVKLMMAHPTARTTIELYKGAEYTKFNDPDLGKLGLRDPGARMRRVFELEAQENKANPKVASFEYRGNSKMPATFSVRSGMSNATQPFDGEKFAPEDALRNAINLAMAVRDRIVYMNGPRGGGPNHAIMRNYPVGYGR